MAHRGKPFTELYTGVVQKLKTILGTKGDVHFSTSSRSGVWELAIRNCGEARARLRLRRVQLQVGDV